jgi:hypothetical protein
VEDEGDRKEGEEDRRGERGLEGAQGGLLYYSA